MKHLSAILAFGLASAVAAAGGQAPKDEKATVKIVGEFTADKDTTLNYTLKKGGKVVAEEKGLKSLPGKAVEVPEADAGGPFELTVSATGGVLKVTKIGVSANAGGKEWKGMFGGRVSDLNARNPSGAIVRSVTFPVTLSPAKDDKAEPKSAGGNAKNDSGKSD